MGELHPQAWCWREAALATPAGLQDRETVALKLPRAILSQDPPQNHCMEIRSAGGNKSGMSRTTQNLMEGPPLQHPGGVVV